jgi:hypothetical protein
MRVLCPEIIEHQEWVKERQFVKAERTVQPYTGTFPGFACSKRLRNGSCMWHSQKSVHPVT